MKILFYDLFKFKIPKILSFACIFLLFLMKEMSILAAHHREVNFILNTI